jgi:hypothetical protein
MAKWRVTKIVAKGDGLNQILVQLQRTPDGASNLGDF